MQKVQKIQHVAILGMTALSILLGGLAFLKIPLPRVVYFILAIVLMVAAVVLGWSARRLSHPE